MMNSRRLTDYCYSDVYTKLQNLRSIDHHIDEIRINNNIEQKITTIPCKTSGQELILSSLELENGLFSVCTSRIRDIPFIRGVRIEIGGPSNFYMMFTLTTTTPIYLIHEHFCELVKEFGINKYNYYPPDVNFQLCNQNKRTVITAWVKDISQATCSVIITDKLVRNFIFNCDYDEVCNIHKDMCILADKYMNMWDKYKNEYINGEICKPLDNEQFVLIRVYDVYQIVLKRTLLKPESKLTYHLKIIDKNNDIFNWTASASLIDCYTIIEDVRNQLITRNIQNNLINYFGHTKSINNNQWQYLNILTSEDIKKQQDEDIYDISDDEIKYSINYSDEICSCDFCTNIDEKSISTIDSDSDYSISDIDLDDDHIISDILTCNKKMYEQKVDGEIMDLYNTLCTDITDKIITTLHKKINKFPIINKNKLTYRSIKIKKEQKSRVEKKSQHSLSIYKRKLQKERQQKDKKISKIRNRTVSTWKENLFE